MTGNSATLIRDIFGEEIHAQQPANSREQNNTVHNQPWAQGAQTFPQNYPQNYPSNGSPSVAPNLMQHQAPFQQQSTLNSNWSNGNLVAPRRKRFPTAAMAIGTSIIIGLTGISFGGKLAWDTITTEFTKLQQQLNLVNTKVDNNKPLSADEVAKAMDAKMAASTVYLTATLTTTDQYGYPQNVQIVGTGFVVAPEVIATDYHCVRGFADGSVHLIRTNQEYKVVKVIAYDERNDVALVYVPGLNAPALPLAQNGNVSVGMSIWGLGNPNGVEGIFSHGSVSAPINAEGLLPVLMDGKYHGDSGAAICNDKGEVIGLVRKGDGSELDLTSLFYVTPVEGLNALMSSVDLKATIAKIKAGDASV